MASTDSAVASVGVVSHTPVCAPVGVPQGGHVAETPAPAAIESFESLLQSVLDRAYGVACHLTRSRDEADDLIQETSLRAFRAFDQYQPGTNFRAWYMRILTNRFYESYRRRKRQPAMTSLDDAEPLYLYGRTRATGIQTEPEDPAASVIARMGEAQVAEAIHALPDEFRIVCTLYFIQDASYQEIADMVDCPVGTVRSRLHRGRRMLQKALWQVAEEHGILEALVKRKQES